MGLVVKPLTLTYANHLIDEWHRHHKPARGQRFSLGCYQEGVIVGACIVGRPVARGYDPQAVAEVSRLVTCGYPNACSILYAAAARACKAMGFLRIQTYILEEELGVSLRAAGWTFEGMTAGGNWDSSERYKAQGRRRDQPEGPKQRWFKQLNRGERE